jgi:hypothetical protein
VSRIPQHLAAKGSQKWIQKLVNEKPDLLNSPIRTQLDLPDTEKITWLSPLADDEYAEYQDQAFLDLLGIKLTKVSLSDFWPSRGPVWDGLGKSDSGNVFLVEAKSHISEVLSPKTGAGVKSLRKIKKSFNETKTFLHSNSERDWSSLFYQYTNRLAHLYLLRALNEVPTYLIFLYFVNDQDMNGPKSVDEWIGALSLLTSYLGIGSHRLKKYIADIFIDVKALRSNLGDVFD